MYEAIVAVVCFFCFFCHVPATACCVRGGVFVFVVQVQAGLPPLPVGVPVEPFESFPW